MNPDIAENEADKRFEKDNQRANGKYIAEMLRADDTDMNATKIQEFVEKLKAIGAKP